MTGPLKTANEELEFPPTNMKEYLRCDLDSKFYNGAHKYLQMPTQLSTTPEKNHHFEKCCDSKQNDRLEKFAGKRFLRATSWNEFKKAHVLTAKKGMTSSIGRKKIELKIHNVSTVSGQVKNKRNRERRENPI